jgi:hypothetical protein
MIGGMGRGPDGACPDPITGRADIMSRFSSDSKVEILRLFRETDLPKKGGRIIKSPSYEGSVGL